MGDLALDSTLQLPMSLSNKDVKTVNVTRIQHSVWISLTVSPTTSLILQAPTPTLGPFRDAMDLTVNRIMILEEGREPLSKIYTLNFESQKIQEFLHLRISLLQLYIIHFSTKHC